MSDGNWREFLKDRGGLVAALFIATLFAIIVFSLARSWQWSADYSAASRAANYAEDAKNDVAVKCARLAGQARDDCSDEIDDAARQHQRNEYDLAAQQTMAVWTTVMGWMAVVGVGLSGVGVYLIWQTWGETRRAALSASSTLDAYIAVERARLTIGIAEIATFGNGVRITLKAWNIGKSSCVVNFVGYLKFDAPEWPDLGFPGKGRDTPIEASEGANVVSYFDHALPGVPFYLIGSVIYASPFQPNHQTSFCVKVSPPKERGRDYRGRIVRVKGQPADT